MKFYCVTRAATADARNMRSICRLVSNTWDDFGFKTTFNITVIDGQGNEHILGFVRIMSKGQVSGVTPLPDQFNKLPDEFCSLGDRGYYKKLAALKQRDRQAVLSGLNDCVFDINRFRRFQEEPAMRSSLLRDASSYDIEFAYKRVLKGDSKLTPFKFTFTLAEANEAPGLEFEVVPHSRPPTNIHVIIGRNGVGKTRLLAGMADALIGNRATPFGIPGSFQFGKLAGDPGDFLNLVIVSYSAFDRFDPVPSGQARTDTSVPYYYVGIKAVRKGSAGEQLIALKSANDLDVDFTEALRAIANEPTRLERWVEAVGTLGSDPRLGELSPDDLLDEERRETSLIAIITAFSYMSSGHKIVLLTMTKLVENVSDRSLVLIDEPETHLHPPLLGSFIRALSRLLAARNGVAVIATHSPVVLQEVPRRCAWFLGRSVPGLGAERPPVETFAENVSVLTRKVFGLEVEESGFYQLLKEGAGDTGSYDDIVEAFGNEVGAEGRALVRAFTWKG